MNPGWSYILTAIGVFGLWLAGRKDWRGWLVGLSAQGVWLAYAVATQQWGFIVSAFAYGWVYALNIWRMRQAPKEPKLMTADTPRRARSLRKDGHVNRVGIVRQSVRDRIEGRAIVTGPPLRRMSKCLLCNLDSGPWLTTQAAEVSGLLHITGHHAAAATPLPALLDAAAERDELAGAWDEGKHSEHAPACRLGDGDCTCPNPYQPEGETHE